MKRTFLKKGLIIMAVAVIIAITAGVSAYTGLSRRDIVTGSVNTLAKPVSTVMSSVVDGLEKLYGYMYKYDRLLAENEQLKAEIAKLEQDYRVYSEISIENERLRNLLQLKERRSDFMYEQVSVLSWSASSWSSSFTINKGSNSGLELYDCVITETGFLVGQVTELGSTSAVVTTFIDPSMNVGSTVYEISDAAVLQGDFALMKEGCAKLSYYSADAEILTGYTVVTSGKGASYPQGLVIGTVTDVAKSSSGLEEYCVIKPAAELNNLTHLYVIVDFEVTE